MSSLPDSLVAAPARPSADPATGVLLAALLPVGAESAATLAIRTPTVRVGRAPTAQLVVDDPSVSAEHAEVRLRGGVWVVEDLGSVNGTWVDGEPVQGTLPLAPGSRVRMGTVEFAFAPHDRWEDSPQATPAADAARGGGPDLAGIVIPSERTGPTFLLGDEPRTGWPTWWIVGSVVLLGLVAVAVATLGRG